MSISKDIIKSINIGDKVKIHTSNEIIIGRVDKKNDDIIKLKKVKASNENETKYFESLYVFNNEIENVFIVQGFYKY